MCALRRGFDDMRLLTRRTLLALQAIETWLEEHLDVRGQRVVKPANLCKHDKYATTFRLAGRGDGVRRAC